MRLDEILDQCMVLFDSLHANGPFTSRRGASSASSAFSMAREHGRKRGGRNMRNGGAVQVFDIVCPDVLDCIVQKAVKADPSCLKRLEQVNRAFRDSAKRCSRTLILRQFRKKVKPRKLEPLKGEKACAALCKEISLRTSLSELVVREGGVSFSRAIYNQRWNSVDARSSEQRLPRFCKLYKASKESLRRLEIELTGFAWINPEDLELIVRAFPQLEHLTIRGDRQPSVVPEMDYMKYCTDLEGTSNGLTSLDFGDILFYDMADVCLHLPACLQNLRSLRLRCDSYIGNFSNPPALSPNVLSLSPLKHLTFLRLDAWNDYETSAFSLQNVGRYCPSLQRLVLHASPGIGTGICSSGKRRFLRFSDALKSTWPDLQQLLISRTEIISGPDFSELLHPYCGSNLGIKEMRSKIIILKDERCEKRCGPLCSVTAFRCLLARHAPWIDWDDPKTQERLLGKAKVVQLWYEAFCQADQ